MNRLIRTAACCALALAALAAHAATASAADFCVGAGLTCDQTFDFTADGLDDAVAAYHASDSGNDKIYVAPGTIEFSGPLTVDSDQAVNGELSIRGAGVGKTTLVFSAVGGSAVQLNFAASDSEFRGFSIESIGDMPDDRVGVDMDGGNAEDVFAYMAPGANKGFSFSDSTRCLSCRAKVSGGSATGFHVEAGGSAYIEEGKAEVYDADPDVHTRGVSLAADDSEVDLSRSLLKNFNRGVFATGGIVRLADSVIDLGDQRDAFGLQLDIQTPLTDSFYSGIDGLTIYGTGDNQQGVYLNSNADGPEAVEVELLNTLVWLPGAGTTELSCSKNDLATASAVIRADYSLAADVNEQGDCPVDETNMTAGTATFVDAASGDLRPAPGSAVIDAGSPTTNYRPFDFYGATRFADGSDLEGAGDIDIGAGEYQNYAPNKPAASASPAVVVVGTPVTFTATGSDPNNQQLTFSWEFEEGGSAAGASVARAYGAPGTYKAKAIASDGSLSRASAWVEVTVVAAPPAPSILLSRPSGKFKYGKRKPKPFALGSASSKPRIPVTTNFAGEVTLTLKRIKGGWTSGKRCVAKKPKRGKPKRCDLALRGSQRLALPAGQSYLTFGGKWGRGALPTGAYRLTVSALGVKHEIAMNAVRNLKG